MTLGLEEGADPVLTGESSQVLERDASPSLQQLTFYMNRFRAKKDLNKKTYVIVRLAVVALGASIPVLTTIDAPSWITALIGAGIVTTTGIAQVFSPQERYVAFRTAYKALDCERMLFLAGAAPYDVDDKTDAKTLVTKTSDIVRFTEALPRRYRGAQAILRTLKGLASDHDSTGVRPRERLPVQWA